MSTGYEKSALDITVQKLRALSIHEPSSDEEEDDDKKGISTPITANHAMLPTAQTSALPRSLPLPTLSTAQTLALPHSQPQPRLVYRVFLGGPCGATTWRQDIAIPLFSAEKISFFNPQKANWSPVDMKAESEAKENSGILLFVIESTTRAIASMLEAVESIVGGRTVVLVVSAIQENQVIEGQDVSSRQLRDLNKARLTLLDLVGRHEENSIIFPTVKEAIHYIINPYEGEVTEEEKPYYLDGSPDDACGDDDLRYSSCENNTTDDDREYGEGEIAIIDCESMSGSSRNSSNSDRMSSDDEVRVTVGEEVKSTRSTKPRLSVMLN